MYNATFIHKMTYTIPWCHIETGYIAGTPYQAARAEPGLTLRRADCLARLGLYFYLMASYQLTSEGGDGAA